MDELRRKQLRELALMDSVLGDPRDSIAYKDATIKAMVAAARLSDEWVACRAVTKIGKDALKGE